jgi:hypothetical protein
MRVYTSVPIIFFPQNGIFPFSPKKQGQLVKNGTRQKINKSLSQHNVTVDKNAENDANGTSVMEANKIIYFFFKFVRWYFEYCGHYWPIVPAPGDR